MIRWIFCTFFLFLLLNIASGQIIHYSMNDTIYATGSLEFDPNQDGNPDFTFEINLLPQGEFAARVVTNGGALILDNSTYGYPDTLTYGDTVQGHWSNGNGVLGTFNNAGQFKGAGDKYLGIQFGDFTGWIELNVSGGNDTLILISAGYTATDNGVFAGQTELLSTSRIQSKDTIGIFPNPASRSIQIQGSHFNPGAVTRIYSATGLIMHYGIYQPQIDISQLPNGMYLVVIEDGKALTKGRFVVHR